MLNEKITSFALLLKKSAECGSLVNIVFHSPEKKGEMLKAKGTLRSIGGECVLQIETSLTEGRVTQENIKFGEIPVMLERYFDIFKKADLNDRGGNASLMISKKGTVSLVKKGKIGESEEKTAVKANDREKNRLLDGSEDFLLALGVSDGKGRVHDKKQSKFRQICRFSEYIAEAEKKLKRNGTLYVYDLCCGKSYLSFAAYHVLTKLCGRDVKMTCVDLKQSVIDYCSDIAKKAGMDGLSFICMNIDDFIPENKPDMVISLHACDIATDIVLNFASRYQADIILSTPCCHHRMMHELDCPTLDFIAKSSILKQKLCDAATDSLRLLKLEAEGYKTDATELIDPEDTPKNVMLRAIRRKNFDETSADAMAKAEKYESTFRFLYGKTPDGSDKIIKHNNNNLL
ncbi:MAG: SAM-dependent methyltransferase [Clostridia bacterium]|nr:SAM-dependent methyltransferase [Clostridia bacterium]